jgi:pyruvate dehydrogenase E2 component (dihydrolipoamide acetyltransferase)
MADAITMPKLGFDMAEGTLVDWSKKVGDQLKEGDVIAEIETDKATIEIESFVTGTILALPAQPGDVLAVGSVIGWVGEPGETPPDDGGSASAAPKAEAAPSVSESQKETIQPQSKVQISPSQPHKTNGSSVGEGYPGGVKASPLARNVAQEKGIDLRQVKGTGPGGRIVKADVEKFTPAAAGATPAFAPEVNGLAVTAFYPEPPRTPDVEIVDTNNLRKRIATRMVQAKQHVPHFYVTTEIDVAAMLAFRKDLNGRITDDSQKISVNDLIVKATALTLREFPNLNSHFYGDKIARHKRINIGVAVALPDGGLMNVVVKDADKISLGTVASQTKAMIARARDGKVKPEDVQDGTFTVSNLGIFDVDHFIAIINPPEAGILAVGSAKKVPVVLEDGSLGVGERMKVTISVDHRISDGAEAAGFLQTLKQLLENPMRLVL